MPFLFALLAGAIFGAGLVVSGMSNPKKVLDFLDVAAMRKGQWDPTLLMVFVGALPVMFLAYRLKGAAPLVGGTYEIPVDGAIDRPLAVGSALFGIGWGLIGFCPGPAVVALALASSNLWSIVVFVAAMLTGVWLAFVLRPMWSENHGVVVPV
jgi:uncharacterized protein